MKYALMLMVLITFCTRAQDTLFFEHSAIPAEDTVLIFLPQDYNERESFPLVFLLHGWQGNHNQWNSTSGGLQKYADRYHTILVCPDGFYGSWYANSPIQENLQYKTYFFEQLYPSLMKLLSVNKDEVFITGLSMGGYGAITLMLERPDLFRAAGSTSGVLDIVPSFGSVGLGEVFGLKDSDKKNYELNSPYYQLHDLKIKKPLYIDCGEADRFYDVNRAFYDRCRELDIPATFVSQPGTHSHAYWAMTIDDHLRFFRRIVNGDQ